MPSGRGRVVKASDSKSDSLWERRFESYRPRKVFFTLVSPYQRSSEMVSPAWHTLDVLKRLLFQR